MILKNPLYQIGILLALALFLLAIWLGFSSTPSVSPDEATHRTEPDVFIENGRYRVFNADDGLSDYDLSSPRGEFWPDKDVAYLTTPELILREKTSSTPWSVHAQTGTFTPGSEKLELQGQVRVQRETPADPVLLESEHLLVEQDKRFIRSDTPIKITDKLGVTRAQRMTFWIDQRLVELTQQVEGEYAVPNRSRP